MKIKPAKKFLLLFFFIYFFANNIFAQEKFFLGCKLGETITYANYDFIKTEIGSNYKPFNKQTLGFNLSLFIEQYYNKNFSLILEVGYNQKALRPILKDEDSDYKLYSSAFNNIFLLFGGKYKFIINDFNPFLVLGLKAEHTIGQAEGFMNFTRYRNYLTGFSAGVGIEIEKIKFLKIIPEVTFTSDFNKHLQINNYKPYKSLNLKLGFKLPIQL